MEKDLNNKILTFYKKNCNFFYIYIKFTSSNDVFQQIWHILMTKFKNFTKKLNHQCARQLKQNKTWNKSTALSSNVNQKVEEKAQTIKFHVSRSFKAWIIIYVYLKPTINRYRYLIITMLLPKPVRPVDSEKKGKDN